MNTKVYFLLKDINQDICKPIYLPVIPRPGEVIRLEGPLNPAIANLIASQVSPYSFWKVEYVSYTINIAKEKVEVLLYLSYA